MPSILLVDIGGTTIRLALSGAGGAVERLMQVTGAEAGPDAVVARYLAETGARPAGAVLAIAGLVTGDEIAVTNRPWRFSLAGLARQFGWTQVRAVNDFEAVARALPALGPGDLRPLGGPSPGGGAKVVFGPGTGLGVAALVPAPGGPLALATEGGHVAFGPAADDEAEVFARLRTAGPVSAETVLSGPGLVRLHHALHPAAPPLAAAGVVGAAAAGNPAARATVALFVRLLGRFAGDLALMFRAHGGVYLTGGVARHLGAMIDAETFRAAFTMHPPYQAWLDTVATSLVTLEEPGLLGCAVLAGEMARAG